MNAALRYLLARSVVNGVLHRLRRLRQPKYLAAALLGGAYFYLYFYEFLGRRMIRPQSPLPVESAIGLWALVLLAATVVLSWVLPASRAAVNFSETEIAFLFPAPVSRRSLVIHKLLRSQFALLFISVLMTLITGRFRLGAEAWFGVGTLWVVLNTLNMHRIGASFALQRLRERGLADARRRVLFMLALGAFAGLIEYTRRNFTMPAMLPGGLPDAAAILDQITGHGPLRYALVPFKMMVAPFFAQNLTGFAFAILPALAIMAAHFIWVVSADIAFEEAAISAAQKRAQFMAAAKWGQIPVSAKSLKARTPLWRLRARGFPPAAFVWKSAIKFGGRRAILLAGVFFALLTVAVLILRANAGEHPQGGVIGVIIAIGILCYLAVLMSLVLVGQNASGQLRQGMTMMDLVKTYPIPGWQLALGELLGPILAGTLLQWCALGVGGFLAASMIPKPAVATAITVIFCTLGIILPVFNTSISILPSASALLFPAWFKPRDAGTPGLEQTGLRLIMGIGQLLAIALAMVPPAFFGACAWFSLERLGASFPWQAAATACAATFVFALEAALGVAWLGDLYDRYDGSSE